MAFCFRKSFLIFPVSAIILALIIAACFSSWEGEEANLTISLGDHSRGVILPGEQASFRHELILIGPGNPIRQSINAPGTVKIRVIPGTWHLTVRAVGNRSDSYSDALFPARGLRAMGWTTIEVKSGQENKASINMRPATEVFNFDQFEMAIIQITELNISDKIIVIADDIVKPDPFSGFLDDLIVGSGTLTLLSDVNVSINVTDLPIQIDGGILYLGRPDSPGELIFDGGDKTGSPIILIDSGELIMDDGVVLQNGGHRGVEMNGGRFFMHGGTIRNNKTNNVGINDSIGGGVYVGEDSAFTMLRGTISGNTAERLGGGVFVFTADTGGGTFIKEGGTIFGNSSNVEVSLQNTVQGGLPQDNAPLLGDAVFAGNFLSTAATITAGTARARNNTAGPDVNMNSTLPGEEGGWE